MEILLGRWLGRGDAADARASIGSVTCGPSAMLRELELRLGLPSVETDAGERTMVMLDLARAHAARHPEAFFARSFAVDATGTASVLLAMRDELVEAGWQGDAIDGAGPRIATLASLAAASDLPPGPADRLVRIAEELPRVSHRLVDRVDLLESLRVWPGTWRTVFDGLARGGTAIDVLRPSFEGAPASTDLGRAQLAIASRKATPNLTPPASASPRPGSRLRGDGTLIAVRAPTSWELGEATAALLRTLAPTHRARSILVVRVGDTAPLDAALVAQGLRSQGLTTATTLRPATQILPLALAMLHAPRDVFRALELLSLPSSPIPRNVRPVLLGALGRSAGVGSQPWRVEVAAMAEADRERVRTWLEPTAWPRADGVPREAVLEVLDRLRTWAHGRRVNDTTGAFDGLVASIGAARAALRADLRGRWLAAELDILLGSCIAASSAEQTGEEPGRPDHLASPDGILRARPVVALWHAGADVSVAETDRFRVSERRALQAVGVLLTDPAHVLEARAASWRRAVLAATECLVVATPDAHVGEPQPTLPIWDEIVAKLGLDAAACAAITVTAQDLREGAATWAIDAVVATPAHRLALPTARTSWHVDAEAAASIAQSTRRLSASAVDSLLGCPLRFILDRAADLRPARVATVSDGATLKGTLGHRLVEELHRRGLLGAPTWSESDARALLTRLTSEEAAPLHRDGRSSNRQQTERQLLKAARRLHELLAASGYDVEGVEVEVSHESVDGTLLGRIDLLLRDREGAPLVLDLKLGRTTYAERLRDGRALQLAHYAEVLRRSRSLPVLPHAAYFSLGGGRAMAIEGTPLDRANTDFVVGPTLAETASKLVTTIAATKDLLATGRIPVTGTGAEPEGLFEVLGGGASLVALHPGEGCVYCDKAPLCGRAWEGFE